ncbi:MAG TPA: hypothetical protein VIF14_05685 [Alphaproteobacteria bacterium]|jgi:hypothetical protein
MGRQSSIVVAVALGAALCEPAQAEAIWLNAPLSTPIVQGQWFLGAGVIGGVYRPPDWNSNVESNSGSVPLGPTKFSVSTGMLGPGGTIGYTFRDGMFPAWMGTNVRIALSGMKWDGDGSSSKSRHFAGTDRARITAIDGRVGFSNPVGGAGFNFDETLRQEFDAFEIDLRLTSDRPIGPNLVLIPTVGVFGGSSREKYESDFIFSQPAFVTAPGFVHERVNSDRIGADLGLGLAWQATSYLRFGIAGRAGFHWVQSRLTADDCWRNVALLTSCSLASGTFVAGSQFATTASDRRSTVGFRGSATTGVTLDGGWIQAQLGGFFTFDSASPGVVNPTAGTAVTPTNVGPAHIRFASGYSAGGFFVVRIGLP